MTLKLTPYQASRSMILRIFRCMYRQQSRTIACPDLPKLDRKTVLVTGGLAGVGEFISIGALARGAKVISFSRGISEGKAELAEIQQIKCDLSDLSSVKEAVEQLNGQKIDILLCNAGVALRKHKMATDDIEMTYAVNVLGHHLLYRLLIEQNLFEAKPRIVMTTGDAYVAATECESNPVKYGMNKVYGGSKLGNLWQVLELSKRYPNIHTIAVHPGAIMSGLGGGVGPKGLTLWLLKRLTINEEQGAQASLIAATQELPQGAYWHNVCGIMGLPVGDAGLDNNKSRKLWEALEALCLPYLEHDK